MALAFIFESVGAGEWLVLLAVLLVVMGPKRLPSTARTIGQYYSKFRRAADTFKRQIMDMDREFDRAVETAEREAREIAEASKIPNAMPSEEELAGGASAAAESGPQDYGTHAD